MTQDRLALLLGKLLLVRLGRLKSRTNARVQMQKIICAEKVVESNVHVVAAVDAAVVRRRRVLVTVRLRLLGRVLVLVRMR
jgi:hypothetical protein